MNNNQLRYINKIKIIKCTGENQKKYFPSKLENLEWKDIKNLSILTGKNGVGKSKILKLILAAFNDETSRKMIEINDGNFEYNSTDIVTLIHFDSNLTNLKNEPYYNKTQEKIRIETNFNIENSFNHLSKELIYSFPTRNSTSPSNEFVQLNKILCQINDPIPIKVLNTVLKAFECQLSFQNEKKKRHVCFKRNRKENTESFSMTMAKISDTEKKFLFDTIISCDYLSGSNTDVLNKTSVINKMNEFLKKYTYFGFYLQLDFKLTINENSTLKELKDFENITPIYRLLKLCSDEINPKNMAQIIQNGLLLNSILNQIKNKTEVTRINKLLTSFNFMEFEVEFEFETKNIYIKENGNKTKINDITSIEILEKLEICLVVMEITSVETVEYINYLQEKYEFQLGKLELKSDNKLYVGGVNVFEFNFKNELVRLFMLAYIHRKLHDENKVKMFNEIISQKDNGIFEIKIKFDEKKIFYIEDTDNGEEKIYKSKLDETNCNKFKNFLELCNKEIGPSEELIANKIYSENLMNKINEKFWQRNQKNLDRFKNESKESYNYEKIMKDYTIDEVLIEEEVLFLSDGGVLAINELTTGEQIIILSALWEYQLKKLKELKELSKLSKDTRMILLLDEPDCFLHPNAVFKFIERLRNLTSDFSNLQVILTSHNPGTVSLMNSENIFYLEKTDGATLELNPCTNETKIKIIEGITDNLFFVLSPFKLVLVEGTSDDCMFYTILYEQLIKKSKIPIVFRSAGDCGLKHIFRKKENEKDAAVEFSNYMFGIIDGDQYINKKDAIKYYFESTIDPSPRNKCDNKKKIIEEVNLYEYLIQQSEEFLKKLEESNYENFKNIYETLIEECEKNKEKLKFTKKEVFKDCFINQKFSGFIKKPNPSSSNKCDMKDIKEKIIKEISLYEENLIRLNRRNLESYLFDPINLFFLFEYLIQQSEDILQKLNGPIYVDFKNDYLRLITECKNNKDILISTKIKIFKECSITETFSAFIKKPKNETQPKLQFIIDKFVEYFSVIPEIKCLHTSNISTVIIKSKSNLKKGRGIRVKYPSWILFGNLKGKKDFIANKIINEHLIIKDLMNNIVLLESKINNITLMNENQGNWKLKMLYFYKKSGYIFTDDLRNLFAKLFKNNNLINERNQKMVVNTKQVSGNDVDLFLRDIWKKERLSHNDELSKAIKFQKINENVYLMPTTGNGNRLWNAISNSIYGNEDNMKMLRLCTYNTFNDNPSYFAVICEKYKQPCKFKVCKRECINLDSSGRDIHILGLSILLRRPIHVYEIARIQGNEIDYSQAKNYNGNNIDYKLLPILLSYFDNHYEPIMLKNITQLPDCSFKHIYKIAVKNNDYSIKRKT